MIQSNIISKADQILRFLTEAGKKTTNQNKKTCILNSY